MGLQIDIVKKLQGFRFQVQLSCEKEIIGVLGASGSGKSMLLNSVAGLIKPDRGRILLEDMTFFDEGKKVNLPPRKRRTGYLFQNYAMFPHMTVMENIAFGLEDMDKKEQQRIAEALLVRFHLSELGSRYPSQLSGGQQQRVALARALAVDPKVLLLDEPFSALDQHLKTHMLKDMKEALKHFDGPTLFVTHNMDEVYHLCDKVLILNQGHVETFGEKEDIFQRPPTLAAAQITGCKNIVSVTRKSDHAVNIPEWGASLVLEIPLTGEKGFIGIRENQIGLGHSGENCFPVWIADESEGPFRTTLYLKIGSPAQHVGDFHLQWEMSKAEREAVRRLSEPFQIYIDPAKVFFMKQEKDRNA